MQKKTKTKEAPAYKLTMSLGADSYTTDGATILACLKKMKPKTNAKSVGKFVCEHDGKVSKIPITLNRIKVVRIFSKPVELELFAKRLTVLL